MLIFFIFIDPNKTYRGAAGKSVGQSAVEGAIAIAISVAVRAGLRVDKTVDHARIPLHGRGLLGLFDFRDLGGFFERRQIVNAGENTICV